MSTTWYAKIDCNFHSNRKARKAGRIGREVFVFILCVNSSKGALGVIAEDDLELEYVAEQLQMSVEEVRDGIAACQHAGLIEIQEGLVSISGWDEHYGKAPLGTAEKQKRYRERLKERKSRGTPPHALPALPDESNALPAPSNALPPVTQEGRKEGREGESRAILPSAEYDHENPMHRGNLALCFWREVSDRRIALAAEFGLATPIPFAEITPVSEPPAFRDLRERIREESNLAPTVCAHILEVLTSEARKTRSLEWIAEKAFREGSWRTARSKVPTWRSASTSAVREKQRIQLASGEEIEVDA